LFVRLVFFTAALALALAAGQIHAEGQEVRRGPVPPWAKASDPLPLPDAPSGAIFVRRQDAEIHIGELGQEQYNGYRVKILQPSALQFGNISISWKSGEGAPTVHQVRIHRDGQTVDVLKDAKFEILRREDQLEAARLDGVLTAVFRVPDLRVGDELEVELTTIGNDPTLSKNASGLLFLNSSPAPGRYHLGLSWEPDRKVDLKMSPDMSAVVEKREGAVDFRFDNPPIVSPPKDAPSRYQWRRVVEYSEFHDWRELSRQLGPLYLKASTLPPRSAVMTEAARIAARDAAPMARASAALKLVQQDVRYIYVGLNGGNLTPATADETWQRRYGDCKAKTVLLLALLRELGIIAEPVVINSNGADDGLDERLPLIQLFDHVLVRAHIDGKDWWLDGTLPPVATPSERPVFAANWILPLSAEGRSIEKLPWRPASVPDDITLYEIDARGGFDKPARIVTTQIIRGVKGLQQEMQFSSVSAAQLTELYRQQAIGDVFQSIDEVQWRYDQTAQASVLKVSGTGKVNWEDEGGGARSLSLPGGGFNPPERRARSADQDQSAPFYTAPGYSCHVTTVRIPTTTEPRQWSAKNSFDQYYFGRTFHRAWQLRDGAIRMVRGDRIDQPEIDAALVQRDNARIGAFDNSMGWIEYRPGRTKGAVGKGETVPATYEIDWTGPDVPCLSSANAR
jgi:hypothetical protein